jgi:serine/threonine protein phosphatase PrpC
MTGLPETCIHLCDHPIAKKNGVREFMSGPRLLRINADFCSRTGRRSENQDYVGLSGDAQDPKFGYVAAVADGVSFGNGGRVAAELVVRGFIEAHYGSNPAAGVARNAARTLAAINAWLHTASLTDEKLRHASTTFTALVMVGRDAHVIHVGDTRAYLLHDEQLTLLTSDHTIRRPEQEHVLLRAVGMEPTVRLDHHSHMLRSHDRLLVCSDGVHATLRDERLRALLLRRRSPAEDAAAIVEAALEAGSQDNASCVIVDVLEVPEVGTQELFAQISALPIAPPPAPGSRIDGFLVHGVLSSGRYSRLLRARDEATSEEVVLKFPQENVAAASTYHHAFVREAWVATRLHSPWIGETIELAAGRQSCLYSAMRFYDGETLEARLTRGPAVSFDEGLAIALRLARAIATLHRAGIIHRDIKPENVLLERGGGLRLIDLGVVRLPMLEEFPGADIPGTPSYMAPELFDGQPGDEASDQYALGATLYRMFSGRYPYGEIEPFSRPRFGQAAPLTRHRPDLPAWLWHVLSRTLQPEPAKRFGDVLELSMELESGLDRGVPIVLRRQSLYERNPLRFWQVVAALLAILLLLSLGLHVR